jgi:hypothetical protein
MDFNHGLLQLQLIDIISAVLRTAWNAGGRPNRPAHIFLLVWRIVAHTYILCNLAVLPLRRIFRFYYVAISLCARLREINPRGRISHGLLFVGSSVSARL